MLGGVGLESRVLSHLTASSLSASRPPLCGSAPRPPKAGSATTPLAATLRGRCLPPSLPQPHQHDHQAGAARSLAARAAFAPPATLQALAAASLTLSFARPHSVSVVGAKLSGGFGAGRKWAGVGRSTASQSIEAEQVRLHVTPQELWEEELEPYITYLTEEERTKVRAGLELAYKAHDGQKRKSGEPYIIHPVAVAHILSDLRLDVDSIVAGLLHDTVEDTDHVTFEQIEADFGRAVRQIVEGETKVSKVTSKVRKAGEVLAAGAPPATSQAKQDKDAADTQQMFMAMAEEVRVIIVKLADRLHNMRTLGFMPAHKQRLIADETLQVFAPLAHLLGLEAIGRELEELSFPRRYPEEHADISRWMDALAVQQEQSVLMSQERLNQALMEDKLLRSMVSRVEVLPCAKDMYQLHCKITEGRSELTEIRDVAQLVIVLHLKNGEDGKAMYLPSSVCYHVLGIIHNVWPPIPGKMKDYIASPKPNGYQSLHTQVLPLGTQGDQDIFPLSLLIRTASMHQVSQLGIVAPAVGPDCDSFSQLELQDLTKNVNWLSGLKEWQREFVGKLTPREFVDAITGDVLGKRVFTFTPKGEVISLPKGATVVDYAYHIHTDVGNCMVGAKVNGAVVSPSYQLRNTDVVEVLTYDGPTARKAIDMHREWLKSAATRTARHKIVRFLREWDEAQALENDVTGRAEDGTTAEDGAASAFAVAETPRGGYGEPSDGGKKGDAEKELGIEKIEQLEPIDMPTTLKISCQDRIGILSEISTLITSRKMFIHTYSGTNDPATGLGTMNFKLQGTTEELSRLCADVAAVDGVVDWTCFSPSGAGGEYMLTNMYKAEKAARRVREGREGREGS